MRPLFKERGYALPDKIRIGCGWPSSRALSVTGRRGGECWAPESAADKHTNIVISLYLDEPLKVAGVLVHELAHAAVGTKFGHRGPFVRCIRAVGLEGKPKEACTPNEDLLKRLNAAFKIVGRYPHARVDGSTRKKQGTRLIKLMCFCGYTVRTTQKWLDLGVPTCWCGGTFFVAETDEDK